MSTVYLPTPGRVWEQALAAVNQRPAILVVVAALFGLQVSSCLYPTPDAVGYLSIARGIGHAHVLANRGSPQLYYPIGYPLLISPIFTFGDRPFLLLSAMNAGLALAFVIGVYGWARRCLPSAAVWIALLTAVNFELMAAARRALSENAFLVVMIGLVNVLEPLAWNTGRRPIARTVLAGLLMILLAAIRPAGITFAAGFGVYLGLAALRGQIRWSQAICRTIAVGVPAAVILLALIAHDKAMAQVAGTVNYLDQVIDPDQTLTGQLVEGIRLRISDIGRLTVPGMFKAYGIRGDWLNVNMLIYVPLAFLCAAGWVKFVCRRSDVLVWTVPFYVALHMVWPFDQAGRFFLPLLPLLLVCLWLALERLSAYQYRLAAMLVLAHACVSLGYWSWTDSPRAHAELRRWPTVDRVAEVIRPDYRPVAVSSALGDAWLLLNYSLDRPVFLQMERAPVPRNVEWFVVPKQASICAGFASVAVRDDCRLLRRIGTEFKK